MTAVLSGSTRPFKPQLYSETAREMGPEEIDFVILAQLIAFRVSGDIEAALVYARRLADRIQNVRHKSRDRLDGPAWYFHHQIASTYLVAGDSGRALLEFATARQLGKLSAQSDAERAALGRIALAHALRGTLGDAEVTLANARSLPDPTLAQVTSCLSTERTTAALIAVDRMTDDVDDLLAVLSPYDSTDLMWPLALLARSRAFVARQQPEHALEAIRLARDSHAVQPRSLAFDVISASSIDAFVATGELARAHRIAADAAEAGFLTRLATIRLALHEGKLDAASRALREVARDRSACPAEHAECVLLNGWLELLRTDEIDRETAVQIHRFAHREDNRRLVTLIPRELVERVVAQLPEDLAADFSATTTGLSYIEIDRRPALTASELRVLNALPDHDSTAATAAALHVSPNTIKSQLRSVYRKLGCSTREEALRIAARSRLLERDAHD
jgi:DNA-binding CsgD family transcriptional regulator